MRPRNQTRPGGKTMMLKRLLILITLLAVCTNANAQRFNTKKIDNSARDGQWEASLLVNYEDGSDVSGSGGESIDLDASLGWGFTIGYNLTAKWNASFRFEMNEPDYTAVVVPENPDIPTQTINYTASRYDSAFNISYNFLEGPVTPFIQAGLGWTMLDSNIPDQAPTTGCWWDPWWGYICDTAWSTYDTTEFTYNAGLGLRWDINTAVFMRGTYYHEWVSVDNGTIGFDTITFDFGLMW
jgi:opacity protein-like surface antigen